MADPEAAPGEESKPDVSAQMDLFAERTEKVAGKLDSVTQQISALAEAAGQASQPAPATPQKLPRLTEDQVFALEERGEITKAQAMAFLTRRAREDAKEDSRRELENVIAHARQQSGTAAVAQKIGEYQKAIPGLASRGSDDWNRVHAAFRDLVNEGHPANNLLTELTAIRHVFGADPSQHSEVRERTKDRNARASEVPSSSATRSRTPSGRAKSEPDADLPDHARNYVQKLINIRQYKGWDDPKAIKYIERYKAGRRSA